MPELSLKELMDNVDCGGMEGGSASDIIITVIYMHYNLACEKKELYCKCLPQYILSNLSGFKKKTIFSNQRIL